MGKWKNRCNTIILKMWNYIIRESDTVEEKKQYTSFPEPTGKSDVSGLLAFEDVETKSSDEMDELRYSRK